MNVLMSITSIRQTFTLPLQPHEKVAAFSSPTAHLKGTIHDRWRCLLAQLIDRMWALFAKILKSA